MQQQHTKNFFLDHPVFSIVVSVVIFLVGIIGLTMLPVDQYPQIVPPVVRISASYPGADAQTVTQAVATPIEQEINGVPGMLYMESSSSNSGSFNAAVTFDISTDPDLAAVDIQNRVKKAEARLPAEVVKNGISVEKESAGKLLTITLLSSDPKYDEVYLSNYATLNVLDMLRRVPGVGSVSNVGSRYYAMRIWVQPDKLADLGLTVKDLQDVLMDQNRESAAGVMGDTPMEGVDITFPIKARGRLSSVDDFEQIVVRANPDGSIIRLRDVARISLEAQGYSTESGIDGVNAAVLNINMLPGANAMEVAASVKREMEEISRSFPEGITYSIPFDTTTYIGESIHHVYRTLFEALLLVIAVVFLSLQSWRATVIPIVAVPISLVGTFAVMLACGFSLNMLTLLGLILAIGIVVDDAIVVVENVERVIAEDKLPPKEATHKSMGQIQRALVGIAVVLSAVFMPMAFMSGATGEIYRQFSITLISSMLLSVFVAMSLTPALCATILKAAPEGGHKPNALFARFNTLFEKSTQHYTDSTRSLLRCTGRYMVVYLLICAGMAVLFLRTPTSFLPEEDQGVFMTTAQLPSGATMVNTTKVLQQVTDYYLTKEKDNVQSVFTVGGFGFSGQGQNNGLAFISLKPWSERVGEENSVTAIIQRAMIALSSINKAVVFPFNLPAVAELGTASGFDMELLDNGNLGHEKLTQARNELLSLAAQSPNQVTGVRPNGLEDTPMFKVNVNAAKAEAMGVALSDINQTISTAFGSSYVNDFLNQGRVKKVYVQAGTPFRMLPDNINQWYVRNASGTMAPLSAYSSTEWTYGSPRLERYNGTPSMEILGEAAAGKSTGDAMKFMADLVAKLPAGVGYSWTGLSYQEALSSNQAPALYAISLVVVFLALAALYESWSIPFSVMLVVPLGVVGALLATDLRGLSNDVYFQVGLLTTIGLSAKNAILIVEFAVEMIQKEGKTPIEAIIEAARMRLRPILMTSLAFILGVLPLVISHGAGSGAQNAVGTGVMGGMFAATVLAIYFVPVFFVVVEHLFARFKKA